MNTSTIGVLISILILVAGLSVTCLTVDEIIHRDDAIYNKIKTLSWDTGKYTLDWNKSFKTKYNDSWYVINVAGYTFNEPWKGHVDFVFWYNIKTGEQHQEFGIINWD